MDKIQLRKLIDEILSEGGPGLEHERLKADLTGWAAGQGFTKAYPCFHDGSQPDVLREITPRRYLFVGDAKDAANETIDNPETLDRVYGYLKRFHNLLGPQGYSGGILAIATNRANEAARWATALNLLARWAGIAGPANSSPNFVVNQLDGHQTWIVYW